MSSNNKLNLWIVLSTLFVLFGMSNVHARHGRSLVRRSKIVKKHKNGTRTIRWVKNGVRHQRVIHGNRNIGWEQSAVKIGKGVTKGISKGRLWGSPFEGRIKNFPSGEKEEHRLFRVKNPKRYAGTKFITVDRLTLPNGDVQQYERNFVEGFFRRTTEWDLGPTRIKHEKIFDLNSGKLLETKRSGQKRAQSLL